MTIRFSGIINISMSSIQVPAIFSLKHSRISRNECQTLFEMTYTKHLSFDEELITSDADCSQLYLYNIYNCARRVRR